MSRLSVTSVAQHLPSFVSKNTVVEVRSRTCEVLWRPGKSREVEPEGCGRAAGLGRHDKRDAQYKENGPPPGACLAVAPRERREGHEAQHAKDEQGNERHHRPGSGRRNLFCPRDRCSSRLRSRRRPGRRFVRLCFLCRTVFWRWHQVVEQKRERGHDDNPKRLDAHLTPRVGL